MTNPTSPGSARGPSAPVNRLDYEIAGSITARPAHVRIARDLLVVLLKLTGFAVIVLGAWSAFAAVLDTFASWMRGTAVFPRGGPAWISICLQAILRELDYLVVGAILVLVAELVAPWLLPRR